MTNRVFSERLNNELDELGMPQRIDERIESFAKFTKTPRTKAQAILDGNMLPNEELLSFLANHFEVKPMWLLGKDDHKH